MVSQPGSGSHAATWSLRSPIMGVLRYFERHWSLNTLTRLFLLFLMTTTLVIGSWLGLATSPAYAASRLQAQPIMQQAPQQPSTASTYHLPYARGRSGDTVQHPNSGPGGGGETNVPAILENHIASVGEQSYYTYMKWQINDHLVAEVNAASGNLVVHASDLHIQGTGVDLSIERFYNSMATDAQTSVLSQHWNLSVGADVYLTTNSDGSITYYSPSATPFTFTPTGNGGFKDPSGLNATLTPPSANNDGNYHLDFHKNHETYEFGSAGHLKVDEDKNGNQVTFNQVNGVVSSITDTQGRVTTYTYDSSGRLITITDPTSRTVQYTYDANGNLASSTDALGQTTTYTYEVGSDDLIQINDPTTHAFKITYSTTSSIDEVASITDNTGATTNFSYTTGPTTNTTVVTDAHEKQTTYKSDAMLHVTNVTDALGHTQAKTYTPNSDVASVMDSLTNTSTFTFDASNNITSASDATGATNTFSYQDSSHPASVTGAQDAQGNTLAYSYDSPGNLTSVKNVTSGGAGETTNYTYNSNGTLATMKDGDGNTTTYSYDGQGNLTRVTPPSPLGATTIVHDSLSRATSVTDGKGQKTSFTYDLLDRITTVHYADGSTVSYTYGAAGNVGSQTDSTGTTHFHYDAANRLLTKTLPSGLVLTLTYDAMGNLTSFTDQGGSTSYSYNAVNLVTSLTDPNGAKTTFGYDNNNRRTSVAYPNGVAISLSYDKAGHETGITSTHAGTTLSSYSYDYGGKSLRQSMKDSVLNQQTTYRYDSMNRLTEAEVFDSSNNKIGDFDYAYDKAGNRTSQVINGTQTTFNYNSANQLTSTSQGTSYSYDANGNETNISTGNVSLVYNAKDQTTSIKGVSMN
ncbi:MAG: DUF6531 domain-containing protein, partial [Chloroflexota bacterium]|nr:DUF6531 domain-containing protein [Chloroflexota bacterium]